MTTLAHGFTVGVGGRPFHPQITPTRKVRVAQVLGCSEATADKKLYGEHALNVELAKVIAADLKAGDTEAVAVTMAAIDAALMGEDIPAWTQAIYDANKADAVEDLAQSEWIQDTCDHNLNAYIAKLAADMFYGTRLLAALKMEQANRRSRG